MEWKDLRVNKIHVSLVIILIDDYSGKIIQSTDILIITETGKKPAQKREGYYIFTNLKEEIIHIRIEAQQFLNKRISVSLTELDEREPYIRIRLKPSRCYPFPKGITVLSGRTMPYAEVFLFSEEFPERERLLYDYEKGSCAIKIFNIHRRNLEGRYFYMWDCDSQNSEIAILKKCLSVNKEEYELGRPLKNDYKKSAAYILPIFEDQADKSGYFFIPIRNMIKEACHVKNESPTSIEDSAEIGMKMKVKVVIEELEIETEVWIQQGKENTLNYPEKEMK